MMWSFWSRGQNWDTKAAEKRKQLTSRIPEGWRLSSKIIHEAKRRSTIAGDFFDSLLDENTLHITQKDPLSLADGIASRTWTAEQVVTAFCKRAAYAHQLMPCLLGIGFTEAIEQAKLLDRYFEVNEKPVGPLHGLPFTLKDQFHVKGLETSFAYVGWLGTFEGKEGTGKERRVESELVRELISLGAVPIAKTSLVQSTWAPETNNNILGYLWNPFNTKLSSGGSSGGEGVVQALRGSAFGIGTDSGGSVSMPTSYNGIYSVKPSPGRLSMKDAVGSGRGNSVITAVPGIMGSSVSSLRLIFQSIVDTQPWLYDPYIFPLPWRSQQEISSDDRIAVGFMEDDGIVAPHPPVARALEIVREALTAQHHTIIQWKPPSHDAIDKLHGPLARGDGCVDAWEAIKLSGEPIVNEIADEFPNGKLRSPTPLPEYECLTIELMEYRNQYHQYWQTTTEKTGTGRPVDAVIMPVSPYAAILPGKFLYGSYTNVVNVLGYCSAVIPVTFADKHLDTVRQDYRPLSELDWKNMSAYDPEAYHGAPAGIQIMGRWLDEEKLLSVAQIVSDALKAHDREVR